MLGEVVMVVEVVDEVEVDPEEEVEVDEGEVPDVVVDVMVDEPVELLDSVTEGVAPVRTPVS